HRRRARARVSHGSTSHRGGVRRRPETGVTFPDIATEIARMAEADQLMRTGAFDPGVDRRNTARMKEIIAAVGWPTRSKVGDQAEHMAWLLVQHADLDPNFQKECFALMSAEQAGEVCLSHLAYLEDRICI